MGRMAGIVRFVGAHRRATVGAVVVALLATGTLLVVVDEDPDDVEVATRDESTTTSASSTTSTTEATTTTSTTEPTTTTTAAPATTAPPPPPTAPPAPPRQVYVVQSNPQGLAAMNPDGSGRHLVAPGAFRALDLAPDGSWLVALLWSEQGEQLVTINSDGSGQRVIAPGGWQSPRISPDGSRIAAIRWVEAVGPQLYLMNRDGTGQQVVRVGEYGLSNQVDWSPDGSRLLFTNSSSQSLASHTLATGEEYYIRPRPGSVNYPVWSPDGSLIAFSNGSDLIVIPSTGGEDRNLTGALAETPTMITWDGAGSLLFSAGSTVYRVRTDGTGLGAIAQGCSSPAA